MLECELHEGEKATQIWVRHDEHWNDPDFRVAADLYIMCENHIVENYVGAWRIPNIIFEYLG